jgi:hypothetical protein
MSAQIPDYDKSAEVTTSPAFFASASLGVIPNLPQPPPSGISPELEIEFRALTERWHSDTRYWSSVTKMAMHPAYQRIIALGEEVIPLILNDLRSTRGHWLWALYVLSGFEDPAPQDATFDEAVDAWLTWGALRYGAI